MEVLSLRESCLRDFGGIAEVVLHFRQARCKEALRNLFSIMLDWAVSEIEVSSLMPFQMLQSGIYVFQSPSSQ